MLLGGKSIAIALPPLSDGRSEKSVSYGGGNVTICKVFDFLYSFGGLCFSLWCRIMFLSDGIISPAFLFFFLLFLQCILSWRDAVPLFEEASESVFTVVASHFRYFDVAVSALVEQCYCFFDSQVVDVVCETCAHFLVKVCAEISAVCTYFACEILHVEVRIEIEFALFCFL